jgi:mono/diheme cytochrome c family protein
MKKWKCPLGIAVLGVLLVAVLVRFLVVGETVVAPDGRRAIALTQPERDLVLAEMRGFLAGLQTITTALTQEDMALVARTARGLGMQTARNVPASLTGKLPLEFKQLGFSVHSDFDQIAVDAEAMGDPAVTLRQISETLTKCVACHQAHQIVTAP